MGFNRRQRNQRDDMAAASLILETVLESVKKIVI
jgi:RNase H-fold protein (predicted Holliday junction resolvase)